DKLFVRHEMAGYEAEVLYQPSFLGLSLSSGQIDAHSKFRIFKDEVKGRYRSTYVRLLANAEFAPFRTSSAFVRRIHLAFKAGPQMATHDARVYDDVIQLSDRSTSFGYVYGTDIRLPIINDIWMTAQFAVINQHLELGKLNINRK